MSQPNWVTPNVVLHRGLLPFRHSGVAWFNLSLAPTPSLLIRIKLCKAAIFLQLSCCLSVDPVSQSWDSYLSMMLVWFQRSFRCPRMLALPLLSRAMFYPSWAALSFQEAMSLFSGLDCPLVCFTRAWTIRKSPVKFQCIVTLHSILWTNSSKQS